ncbi:MAG: CARDB domain-containing protein [Phycisphaerae bacterium]
MNRKMVRLTTLAIVATGAVALLGCRGSMPHAFTWPASGDIVQSHPKPPEGGYYSNWDPYAVELTVEPLEDVNPVRTQHVLVATVKDKDGKPLPNRRVEWIISEGSVGDIVEVDESGWRASRGYKVDNHYAVSHTNNGAHVLTRGNDDPSDDVSLTEGQTWCVITSPVEGTTHVTVYAPGIFDWSKHKVFAVKHWYDVKWAWPPDAVNRVGTPHELVSRITRYSDGAPLVNHEVTYKLTGGPAGSFSPGGGRAITVRTDENGVARATLNQSAPAEGENTIEIDLSRPASEPCCKPAVQIAHGSCRKRWVAPKIAIHKTAPARAEVGDTFDYQIAVANPSTVAAENVVVTDRLPDGIEFVSSNPPSAGSSLSWSLGTLAGGATSQISVRVRATRTGKFNNCAEVSAALGLTDHACAETVVSAPALAVEIQCQAEALLCDLVPVRVTVRNTGDGAARNVDVQLQLPDGVTTASGKGAVSLRAVALAGGESKEATFQAKAARPGSYTFAAQATADRVSPASAQCTTHVTEPRLTVEARPTRGAPHYVGRTVEYDIVVHNTGDAPARGATLEATWTGGLAFRSATDGGQARDSGAAWSLGDLAPGATRSVHLVLTATAIGATTSHVSARAYCASAEATVPLEIAGIPAILVEVIDIDDPVEVGKTTTYEIRVTNQGSIDGQNIVVTAELPPQQEFVSASPANKADGRAVRFEPLARLAPKATATFRVVVKATGTGDVRFKVSVTSAQSSEPIMETESTNQYE